MLDMRSLRQRQIAEAAPSAKGCADVGNVAIIKGASSFGFTIDTLCSALCTLVRVFG